MSAEHNHPPRCCCRTSRSTVGEFVILDGCDACPEHGELPPPQTAEDRSNRFWKGTALESVDTMLAAATPYTEQETTNG